jgi:hypothetical protein
MCQDLRQDTYELGCIPSPLLFYLLDSNPRRHDCGGGGLVRNLVRVALP